MRRGLIIQMTKWLSSGLGQMAGYLIVILAGLLVASCSDHDDGVGNGSESSSAKPISFSSGSNQTRATTKTSIEYEDNFYILAFDHLTHDLYIGFSSGTGTGLTYSGIELKHYNAELWAPEDKRTLYWPGGALDFCAYYPNGATISHNSSREMVYTASNAIADQKDILYAYKGNVMATDDDITENTFIDADNFSFLTKTVTLNFKHALSQVGFTASVGQNWDVTIKSITIHNVYSAGTFDYSTATWTNTGTPNNAIPFTLATPEVFNGVSASRELKANAAGTEILILMPQTLNNPWVPSSTNPISATATSLQSYVDIECKIMNRSNSSYYAGTASAYGHVYAPIDGMWEAGKKYSYEIAFGAGYKDTGEATIQFLTLSAKITDWVEGNTYTGQAEFD